MENAWPGMFANRQYTTATSPKSLTWPQRYRIYTDEPNDLVREIVENRQYSLQVASDGSPIQLYYEFSDDGRWVTHATLGFFFAGDATTDVDIEPAGEVLPIHGGIHRPGWMRLDYDPHAQSIDTVHFYTHLHTSLSPRMRVPVTAVPTPMQFLEMVMSWFYPADYRQTALGGTGAVKDSHCKAVFGSHFEWKPFGFEANTCRIEVLRV